QLRLSNEVCRPLPETLEAIKNADIITIGPGSLYTSLIPNLLVDGIVDAMRDSTAIKVYICNIMTQPGETDYFNVEDHLRVLFEYSPELEIDYAVVNTAPISTELSEKYFADGAARVEVGSFAKGAFETELYPAFVEVRERVHGFQLVCRNVLHEDGLVRHDPDKLARLVLNIRQSERVEVR